MKETAAFEPTAVVYSPVKRPGVAQRVPGS